MVPWVGLSRRPTTVRLLVRRVRPIRRVLPPAQHPVAGVDAGGTVWTLAAGRWSRAGALPGRPEAFTVAGDGTFLAATAAGVHSSADAGGSWARIAATTS